MKLIIDHQIFSSQNVGGVSRYFIELVNGLSSANDINAEIYAPLHCNNYLEDMHSFNGLKVKYVPKIYRFIQPINHLLSKYHFSSDPPDLVHETYYQYESAAPKGCPVVVSAYDLIHERYHTNFRIKDETTLRKRAALRRADHVIAISESTRRDYIEFFNVPPDKITTVLLGNSFPIANSLPSLSQDLYPRPYILFVGGRNGYKNFNRLVEAYFGSRLVSGSLDLLCFGGGDFSSSEKNFISQYGGKNAGQVRQIAGTDSSLYEHYRNARLMVYPSLYEGFGLPPLEAMAAGCPVACTNTSSVPEVVGNAALMFDPLRVEEIRECLERLSFNDEIVSELQLKGFNRAQELSWKKCVDSTASVYSRVLEKE